MENTIHRLISEELTKQDVRSIVNSKLEDYLKDREFVSTVRSIAADAVESLFKELWQKSGFWKNAVKKR